MKKVTLYALAMCFIATQQSNAQTEKILTGNEAASYYSGADMIRFKGGQVAPEYIHLKSQNRIPTASRATWLRKLLKITENADLKELSSFNDKLGMTHYKYQQTVNNVPVEGGIYLLHCANSSIYSANGHFYSSLNVNTQASLSPDAAIQKALSDIAAEKYKWEDEEADKALKMLLNNPNAQYYPQPTLCIVPESGNYKSPNFRLAWKMDIYATKPLARYWVYIDAQNGNVLWKQERIHTNDVPGTANTAYSGTRSIVCDQNGSTYRLHEASRGNGVQTFNMNNGTDYNTVTDFTSASTTFSNGAPDIYGYDAHWGAEMVYDYYKNVHGRNSIDNAGYKLWSYVHYDVNYDNAFWDGQEMTYGDGGGGTFTGPLTTIDITGHEISHGLTSFTANLDYQDESGALNESFSDIFGVTIDNYGRGTTGSPLWLIGEEVSSGGIRSMSNPNSFGDPDTYNGTNYYTGTGDNGGVHTNSSVQNFWYYLLVNGGSGTNDIGNSYSVTGVGITNAANIAFRNLTVYLTNSSDFSDARFYAIQSAVDLFGGCTPEVEATTNAWYAVGVGVIYSPVTIAAFSTPTTSFCQAPSTVTFTNNSQNGVSYLWTFGDGTTSTQQSPTHTYTNYGQYTVTLSVNGGACGNDSTGQLNYIDLDAMMPCVVTLSTSGTNPTQTTCNGTVYDDGGASGNYTDNYTSVLTIAPTSATAVTLTFSSFNYESSYDFLNIYDGPSTASPLIGAYTGATLPNGGTIVSSSGSITIEHTSDQAVNESGFAFTWQCTMPTLPPSCDFQANTTSSCDGNVFFTDLSTNGVSTWLWDFGDGNTSNVQNPSHNYTADGTYTVTLTVTNINGSDATTKTNYIVVNHIDAPVCSYTMICSPDSVLLSASASGTINWYADSLGTTLLNTGSNYTTPVISSATNYYLQNQATSVMGNVGPVDDNFGTGGYHNNTSTQYLEFTVYQPITITSVWVDAGSAGNRTVSLWDGAGNLLDTRLVNIASGTSTVVLNFDVQPGSYRIGGTSMDLYRNNAGASFPYSMSGVVDITGSSAGAAYYYYFYNWEIAQTCKSVMTEVSVSVAISSSPFSYVETSPLNVSFTNGTVGATSYSWNFGDGGTSSLQNPTHTYTTSGVYTVKEIITSGSCSDTITTEVNVNGYTGIAENTTENFSFEAFPNPTNNVLTVQYSLNMETDVQITVCDLTGRQVQQLYAGKVNGKQQLTWNTQNVAEGVYMLVFKSANYNVPLKVIVEK